jgi:hypothetical protein
MSEKDDSPRSHEEHEGKACFNAVLRVLRGFVVKTK